MNQIYKDDTFKIYKVDDGYVLHNYRLKEFRHTHIKNYKTCLYLIRLSKHKKSPHDLSKYLIISLIRINDDEKYLVRLNELLENKYGNKKDYYINVNKGRKRHR